MTRRAGRRKRRCCEPGCAGAVFRPVARLASGTVLGVCLDCWVRLDYGTYMYPAMSDADSAALGSL